MLRRLPEHLINQIAAGEVVANPASVAKELIENAIDAHATKITITLEHAGIARLCVTDNGQGIHPTDLPRVIESHTTSKMPHDRIDAITTMGFRGEALPSIGAVSHMTITSKVSAEPQAWAITVDAGTATPVMPGSLSAGARVDVRNLFYATPARLKFLKSPATELHHIVDRVMHIALAAPHIHLTIQNEKKVLLDLPACAQNATQERTQQVIGHAPDLVPISFQANGASIEGYIGIPTLNKRTSNHLFFIVNNRCCQNRNLITATRFAYGDRVPKGRFPVGTFWLTLPQEDVDINAHPSKMDVRFRNSGTIRLLIEQAIQEKLEVLPAQTTHTLTHQTIQSFTPAESPLPRVPSPSIEHATTKPSTSSRPYRTPHTHPTIPYTEVPQQTTTQQAPPLGFPRCQLYQTYIISEAQDALVITDQHAAHERIVYEDMKRQAQEAQLTAQPLLAPIALTIPTHQTAILQALDPLLRQWGFELRYNPTPTVTQVPSVLKDSNIAQIVDDFFQEILAQNMSQAPQDALHALCSTTACHNSIRAGQTLSLQEMSDLLRAIERTPAASQCNHGRPTHIKLSKKDMDRLFDRL